MALPLLDAMVPALSALATTPAKPVRRLGFIYIPNGTIQNMWVPATTGAGFEFSPILSPLASLRDRIVVLSARPARVRETIAVDIPRPRTVASVIAHPRFVQLRDHCWRLLREAAG